MFVLADELVVSTVHYLCSYADRGKLILSLIGVLEQLLVLLGKVALLCVATCHLLVMLIALVDLNAVFASAVLFSVELTRCLVVDACAPLVLRRASSESYNNLCASVVISVVVNIGVCLTECCYCA